MSDRSLDLGTIDDLAERKALAGSIDGIQVVAFMVDGQVVVYENRCPHQHFPVMHRGHIENGCVICPQHDWIFDLKTGRNVSGNGRLRPLPFEIVNTWIVVHLPEDLF